MTRVGARHDEHVMPRPTRHHGKIPGTAREGVSGQSGAAAYTSASRSPMAGTGAFGPPGTPDQTRWRPVACQFPGFCPRKTRWRPVACLGCGGVWGRVLILRFATRAKKAASADLSPRFANQICKVFENIWTDATDSRSVKRLPSEKDTTALLPGKWQKNDRS